MSSVGDLQARNFQVLYFDGKYKNEVARSIQDCDIKKGGKGTDRSLPRRDWTE